MMGNVTCAAATCTSGVLVVKEAALDDRDRERLRLFGGMSDEMKEIMLVQM